MIADNDEVTFDANEEKVTDDEGNRNLLQNRKEAFYERFNKEI